MYRTVCSASSISFVKSFSYCNFKNKRFSPRKAPLSFAIEYFTIRSNVSFGLVCVRLVKRKYNCRILWNDSRRKKNLISLKKTYLRFQYSTRNTRNRLVDRVFMTFLLSARVLDMFKNIKWQKTRKKYFFNFRLLTESTVFHHNHMLYNMLRLIRSNNGTLRKHVLQIETVFEHRKLTKKLLLQFLNIYIFTRLYNRH